MGIIVLFLAAAVFLESSITTLPLVLSVILFSSVVLRKNEVFLLSFISGLFLDILAFRTIGLSSLYLVLFVFVIFLYEKKFEIETLYFVGLFSFLGSAGYLFLIGSKGGLIQASVMTLITALSFLIFKISNRAHLKKI
ncbi:MAG: hypothetical protein US51_C0022G0005 [Microgenomates group bacterium GW2011_GWA2_37_6]|nr:MAG: hypothetical protein US51_C0022G0005 [Microgenomates group bacterium GW2011_GWA2_37_6]